MDAEEMYKRLATSIAAFAAQAEEEMAGTLGFWLDHAEDICESEIEKVFLLAWIAKLREFELFGSPGGGSARWTLFSPTDDSPLDPPEFSDPIRQYDFVKGQFHTCGYRADFAIRRFIKVDGSYLISSPRVLVECDGHDFHEKTKEQAARDKERDRVLQQEGFYVLRFTGSELWRDPAACATQVDEFLCSHMIRSIKEKGVR